MVNEPDDDGFTPLWQAGTKHIDIIKWWIASGSEMDLGTPGDISKTDAISIAKKYGQPEAVALLERFKSDAAETRSEVRKELGITGQFHSFFSIDENFFKLIKISRSPLRQSSPCSSTSPSLPRLYLLLLLSLSKLSSNLLLFFQVSLFNHFFLILPFSNLLVFSFAGPASSSAKPSTSSTPPPSAKPPSIPQPTPAPAATPSMPGACLLLSPTLSLLLLIFFLASFFCSGPAFLRRQQARRALFLSR